MGNAYKNTLLFQFSPEAGLWNSETPLRAAGWSESLWSTLSPLPANWRTWINTRALFLAEDCSIVGWRSTPYTYTGNKLIPGHSTVGTQSAEGVAKGTTNSPDDTLRLQCLAGAVPVTAPYLLHGVPDENIISGQYIGTASGIDPVSTIIGVLSNRVGAGLGQILWLGRDPTQVAQRVLAVNGAAATVRVQASLGVGVNVDFVRFRRVYDDNGNPIKGTWLVTNIVANADGSFTYTLSGLPNQTRSTPSGTARRDLIATSPFTAVSVKELASRKAGRPFFLYRGRRTKSRV